MNLFTQLMIYNLVASIILYGSLAYNPRMWLHRMPPEARRKVPDKTPEERKVFRFVALPFLLLLFGYPLFFALQMNEGFGATFISLIAFFAGFALWDTLVLDLLIFCKFTPRFVIMPGTIREDYSNMRYHLVSGAKGLLMSIVFSGLLATILSL